MALQKTLSLTGACFIETPAGLVKRGVESVDFNAYVKVVSVAGDKNELIASVTFSNGENVMEKQYRVPVSVDNEAKNFIAQAYAHLKTLPEFAEATDC